MHGTCLATLCLGQKLLALALYAWLHTASKIKVRLPQNLLAFSMCCEHGTYKDVSLGAVFMLGVLHDALRSMMNQLCSLL